MSDRMEAGNELDESQIVAWDCHDDAECLHYTMIGDAVEAWADRWGDDNDTPIPATVTVYGFARTELPSAEKIARDVLEPLLERLDEDYANPEDDGQAATEGMKRAALALAEVVRAEYDVWTCEPVTHRLVRVRDYVPADWNVAPDEATEPAPAAKAAVQPDSR